MTSDARLAARVASQAGERLLEIRKAWSGEDRRELGRRGDLESNRFILAELERSRPGDRVLSEESADDLGRLEADRVWIVDPLDGTREFTMDGRTDWAVHVALWEAGKGLTAGAVSQPAVGTTYATDAPVPPARSPQAVILVSDSRPPAFASEVAESVGAHLAPMGSAGAKAMAVVRSEAVAYLHAGGQWEWDSAAPVAVAIAAGLHASRLDGSPLVYNGERPYLPDLVICRLEWAEKLLGAVARLT